MHNAHLFTKSLKVLQELREILAWRRCAMHPITEHAHQLVVKVVSITMENIKL